MLNRPTYRLNGRTYKTVNGLSAAIFKDCRCDSHSMVTADRRIIATVGRDATLTTIAVYAVDAPEVGKIMNVIRIS